MSGGLFHGYEEASRVSTFAANGQSQSKEAKYHRAYRNDPKNKDRINSQKKRRRALKKECELGSVSSMFESAALPVKAEQQTIENVLSKSDKASLSDSKPDSSLVSQQVLAEVLRQLAETRKELENHTRQKHDLKCRLEECMAKILAFPDNKELAEANARAQKTIALENELAAIKHSLHDILEWQNEINKTASPTTSSVTLKEKRNVSSTANANEETLADQNNNFQADKSNFLSGIFSKLSRLDGGAFIKNFPLAVILGFCAYHACLFVVEQTIPLYESLQFPNPQMACYGAVGIAVGFSALSAISRAEIIKLFTAVIIAYEVLIVWSGSQANQKELASEALRLNPTHFSVSESYSIAKIDYEQKKTRYEDKNSEVYHNGWFKNTHLDPAKTEMDEASAKLVAIESELGKKYSTNWIHLVLKALYRLSAVAFLMLLAKESIKRGVGALSFGSVSMQT